MADDWKPACDMRHLRLRAQMLNDIRLFFLGRDVMEVETPLLSHATGTDPQLDFFSTFFRYPPQNRSVFLQTSPEFAMKRLLAAGSGSIYQICKAFRNGETGRMHNPEFTILEWYRVDFNLHQLMAEVADLLSGLTARLYEILPIVKIGYREFFLEITGLDPLTFDKSAYRIFAENRGLSEAVSLCADNHVLWLDFIFSHCLQPAMPANVIYFVHGFPAIQSSLARIHPQDSKISERFEVFMNGVELGNGFFELADADEQEARFDKEIGFRQHQGLPPVAKDQRLLSALRSGLPDCSGVAIGLDRLLMIISGKDNITDVLAFPFANA